MVREPCSLPREVVLNGEEPLPELLDPSLNDEARVPTRPEAFLTGEGSDPSLFDRSPQR